MYNVNSQEGIAHSNATKPLGIFPKNLDIRAFKWGIKLLSSIVRSHEVTGPQCVKLAWSLTFMDVEKRSQNSQNYFIKVVNSEINWG